MTRLPVLHQRPRTLADCKFFGAPAPTKSADTRAFDEVLELDVDDIDEDDAYRDELDEQLDAAAERVAEQRREEGGVPCPFVGCAEHLAWLAIGIPKPLELSESELLTALPRLEALDLDTLPTTCAQRGPYTLEEIGWFFDVTRERIRQLEIKAFKKLRHPARNSDLQGFTSDGQEFSRPDLVEKSTAIGLSFKQVSDAASRLVPEMAAASALASERAKRAEKRARRKPTSAKASSAATERVFAQVFAEAFTPAKSEPTPAPTAAAEQLTHDVDVIARKPAAPPTTTTDITADASAPAAREDHVQSEPTITAPPHPKAPTMTRKRAPNANPKRVSVRREREPTSIVEQIIRDAQRGFSAIAERVGKGRR